MEKFTFCLIFPAYRCNLFVWFFFKWKKNIYNLDNYIPPRTSHWFYNIFASGLYMYSWYLLSGLVCDIFDLFKETAYPTVYIIVFKRFHSLKCKQKNGQTNASNTDTGHFGIDTCVCVGKIEKKIKNISVLR